MSTKKKKGKLTAAEIENNEITNDGNEEPDTDEEDTYRDPPEGCVHLRPSIASPHIPSTIYVEYPPGLKLKRRDTGYIEDLGDRKMGYKSHWERICIRNAFVRAGFKKSSKYWTALWSKHQNSSQLEELNCLQKVNHFPSSWCIGRKDRLSRTLSIMKRLHGNDVFDYHPDTYIMPSDMDIFVRLLKLEIQSAISGRKSSEGFWIMKPVASSCGRGISVVTSSQALSLLTSSSNKKKAAAAKSMLFQKYLENPLLINKKKFDLRIYVLVTGVDPLRVYIHKEGLTRISTSNFSLKNIKNRFAHLTNYSVNKKNAIFKAAAYEPQAEVGSSQVAGSPSIIPQPEVRSTTASAGETTVDNDIDSDNEINDVQNAEPDAQVLPGNSNDPEMEGYKWSLHAFKAWLSTQYSPQIMQETFQRVFDIIIKTMIAMEGEITPLIQRSVNYRTNCFELFGCDVILDDKLQPHLLEVNVSPSLIGSSPLDKRIKGMLIADVLHTVGMYPYDPVLLRKYDGVRSEESDSIAMTTALSAATAASSGKRSFLAGHSKPTGEGKSVSLAGPSTTFNIASNPFAFSNLSRLMNSQDAYRRNSCSENIDLEALSAQSGQQLSNEGGGNGGNSSWWQILVLIEDEMHRAKSGGFIQVHPILPTRALPASLKLSPEFIVAGLSSPVPHTGEYYLSLYRNARFHDHLLYKWLSLGGCRGQAGQKFLPRYVFTHIRNNIETQRDIYAELQQVGTAHFVNSRNALSTSDPTGNTQQASSKRRARSLSATRPSSAASIHSSTLLATSNSATNSNHRPYSSSTRAIANTEGDSPIDMFATTTLSLSPSGNHLQHQIALQSIPVHGHFSASAGSVHTSLPPKSRPPSSSRGRTYTTPNSPAVQASVESTSRPLFTSERVMEAEKELLLSDDVLNSTLVHDYYARYSRSHRSPLSGSPTLNSTMGSETNATAVAQETLHLQLPQQAEGAADSSIREALTSSSMPTSPHVAHYHTNPHNQQHHNQRLQSQVPGSSHHPTTMTTPKSRFISTTMDRTPDERHHALSAASAAAAAAFAYAYGIDPTTSSKLKRVPEHQSPTTAGPDQKQPRSSVDSTEGDTSQLSKEHLSNGKNRQRSLSAPSTSRATLRDSPPKKSNSASNEDILDSTYNADEKSISAMPLEGNNKVLDILRERRYMRRAQEEHMAQLRENLSPQVYQQQEQIAMHQSQQQQQHRMYSHQQQITARNLTVYQQAATTHFHHNHNHSPAPREMMQNDLLLPKRAATQSTSSKASNSSSSNRNIPKESSNSFNTSNSSKSNSPAAALAKHMQWQQQQASRLQRQQAQQKGYSQATTHSISSSNKL
jgi:hypothetical protein